MLFSVIIPVYKVEKYIDQCIQSVLCQNFDDYEIILVDDGSPDNCPYICDTYANKYQDKVKVIHKENGGLSDARNAGIRSASGKYLLFVDGDDYWEHKDIISNFSRAIDEFGNPEMIMFQGKKYYEDTGTIVDDIDFNVDCINNQTKDEIIKYLITSQTYSMSACTKIISREFIVRNECFFEIGLLGEDLDWFLKVITYVSSLKAINEKCYNYRIHKGSITTSVNIKLEKDQLFIIKKWRMFFDNHLADMNNNKYYYAILAYAYMVALLNYGKLKQNEKKVICSELKCERSVLKYAGNRKTRTTQVFVRIFGINVTAILLGIYYKAKTKYRI